MGSEKAIGAIVGPGNIGTDLLAKLRRSEHVDVRYMVGVVPESDGLTRAAELGLETSAEGVEWLLGRPVLPDLVFEATSAKAHVANAPRYAEAGITAVDLTPAALGPFTCPVVPTRRPTTAPHGRAARGGVVGDQLAAPNVNMISCGGQATIPIVHAVSRVTPVPYAEIVASVSSRSAGPGTRANIDEFTVTTAAGIEQVGGAAKGKAIIIINPVEPPMIMRDTVFCAIDPDADRDAVSESIEAMVRDVQVYVPGYRLKAEPQYDDPRPGWGGQARVAVFLEVAGNGDYLPTYAGNLDIMTAAAARVGDLLGERIVSERAGVRA